MRSRVIFHLHSAEPLPRNLASRNVLRSSFRVIVSTEAGAGYVGALGVLEDKIRLVRTASLDLGTEVEPEGVVLWGPEKFSAEGRELFDHLNKHSSGVQYCFDDVDMALRAKVLVDVRPPYTYPKRVFLEAQALGRTIVVPDGIVAREAYGDDAVYLTEASRKAVLVSLCREPREGVERKVPHPDEAFKALQGIYAEAL